MLPSTAVCIVIHSCGASNGGAENAGHENDGRENAGMK